MRCNGEGNINTVSILKMLKVSNSVINLQHTVKNFCRLSMYGYIPDRVIFKSLLGVTLGFVWDGGMCWIFPNDLLHLSSFVILSLLYFYWGRKLYQSRIFSSVQFSRSVVTDSLPWITARQASLFITNTWSSLRLTSIESVMSSNHLILCHPLLLLPSIFLSIRVFSNESALRIRWPKYWSFSFNISPSNEHPGLISFRMDWLDLLAVQGTLRSLSQHHSSKASILLCLSFFIVQLSHPYMTTGKTIALTRQTFVGKVMSLLLNMLFRLVITFFPRNKCLLMVNNLDSILKTRDITLPTKVRLVKAMVFPVLMYGCESFFTYLWRKLSAEELMLLNCGVGKDSWESLGLQGDPTSPSWRRSTLNIQCKDRCWSWNSNILAISCEELTHWKNPWCWEGLRTGGEGDDRGWDGWMASPTW